jgi:hypothetical protein
VIGVYLIRHDRPLAAVISILETSAASSSLSLARVLFKYAKSSKIGSKGRWKRPFLSAYLLANKPTIIARLASFTKPGDWGTAAPGRAAYSGPNGNYLFTMG